MAPNGRKTIIATPTSTGVTTRAMYKQTRRKNQSRKQKTVIDLAQKVLESTTDKKVIREQEAVKGIEFDQNVVDDTSNSGCSTPKAERYRIPEILTCPNAPMKKRLISNNCRSRRAISFFASPDIDLFFLFAHGDVSISKG